MSICDKHLHGDCPALQTRESFTGSERDGYGSLSSRRSVMATRSSVIFHLFRSAGVTLAEFSALWRWNASGFDVETGTPARCRT